MPSLTRAQIRQYAASFNGEHLGEPGSFIATTWNALIDTATDEVARLTDSYSTTQVLDTVASQTIYPPPDRIYNTTGVQWIDTTGTYFRLIPTTNKQLDAMYGHGPVGGASQWRNAQTGNPQYYSTRGENILRIYPTASSSSFVYAYTDLVIGTNTYQLTSAARPFVSTDVNALVRVNAPSPTSGFTSGVYTILSVSGVTATVDNPVGTAGTAAGVATLSQGGLLVEGIGIPGGSWPNQTDTCPLVMRTHIAVAWRVAMLRNINATPNKDRYALLKVEFDQQMRLLESEAINLSEETRAGDHQSMPSGRVYW